MIKILTASKDTYIQNRIIKNISCVESNVGRGPTLDLFKLTKIKKDNSIHKEISRLLLQFDLSEIRELSNNSDIDIESETFKAKLVLKNVESAQTIPNNFTLKLMPLNKNFDEGNGIDIIYYNDLDVANFLTASATTFSTWSISGAGASGSINEDVDQLIFSGSTLLEKTQFFKEGTENLSIDITSLIKDIIHDNIPDNGFAISFSGSIESDNNTYFVKRFGSNQSFDPFYRPKLIIEYDDSVIDSLPYGLLNSSGSTFLYNTNRKTGLLENIKHNGQSLTGSNCLLLNIKSSETSSINFFFTGSQISTGKYKCDFFIEDNGDLADIINELGSIKLKTNWKTLDKSIILSELDEFEFYRQSKQFVGEDELYINIKHFKSEYKLSEKPLFPIFIYEKSFNLKLKKIPAEKKTLFLHGFKYSIRDIETNENIIDASESTKISNDTNKCFITVDMSNLIPGRSYVIDIMHEDLLTKTSVLYKNISPIFKVTEK